MRKDFAPNPFRCAMAERVPAEVVRKVRKLVMLPDEAKHSRFALSITRLTVLKSLCREAEVTNRFVTHLAQRTRQKVEEKAKRPGYLSMEEWERHRKMMERAVSVMEKYVQQPTEAGHRQLWTHFHHLVEEQNEYRRVYGGPVRIIKNNDLLLVEYALRTVLADEANRPYWAYQTARHYVERYDPRHGDGITPASAPGVQEIADFWTREFGLTPETIATPARSRKLNAMKSSGKQKVEFTHRQGQCLAFLHLYRKLHRRGAAEQDMAKFFRLTPPAVHGMIDKLEELGLIAREQGVARSVRVTLSEEEIPPLEEVEGPPW